MEESHGFPLACPGRSGRKMCRISEAGIRTCSEVFESRTASLDVPEEPIGDSSPEPVELYSHPHQAPVIKNGLIGFVEVVALKKLKLQGDG